MSERRRHDFFETFEREAVERRARTGLTIARVAQATVEAIRKR